MYFPIDTDNSWSWCSEPVEELDRNINIFIGTLYNMYI